MTIRVAIENREPSMMSDASNGRRMPVEVGTPGLMALDTIMPGETKEFVIFHGRHLVVAERDHGIDGRVKPLPPIAPYPCRDPQPTVKSLNETCDDLRRELKGVEETLRALVKQREMSGNHIEKFPGQVSEMKAQTMLAVRHIEDARMRIGKILQYADDGVSILDKQK